MELLHAQDYWPDPSAYYVSKTKSNKQININTICLAAALLHASMVSTTGDSESLSLDVQKVPFMTSSFDTLSFALNTTTKNNIHLVSKQIIKLIKCLLLFVKIKFSSLPNWLEFGTIEKKKKVN